MVTGIAYGTFDLLHYGHIRMLEWAKSQVDRLIVAVSTDEFNEKKGKKAVYPYWQRAEMIKALRCVDMVIPEYCWEQKDKDCHDYLAAYIFVDNRWQENCELFGKNTNTEYPVRSPLLSTNEIKEQIRCE